MRDSRTCSTYFDFAGRVQRTKRELLSVLIKAKKEGKRICGYGAPGKGNTLLNYAAIGTDFLDFTVDRNPYKHGRYTPGMHIPIYPVEAIDDAKPDYILILPWNLKDEIVQQMRHVGKWGAKFIVPIPSVSIIDPNQGSHLSAYFAPAGLRPVRQVDRQNFLQLLANISAMSLLALGSRLNACYQLGVSFALVLDRRPARIRRALSSGF